MMKGKVDEMGFCCLNKSLVCARSPHPSIRTSIVSQWNSADVEHCHLDKYIFQFGQIHFLIWTNTFLIWTNTFFDLDKYIF